MEALRSPSTTPVLVSSVFSERPSWIRYNEIEEEREQDGIYRYA